MSDPPPPDETDTATGVEGGRQTASVERTLVRLALALTIAPLGLSLLHLLLAVGGDYHPVGDLALTEMDVRDVGDHLLLVGPYSRDGWFHPGPALFYVLAVPYRLLGGSSLGLPAGALLVNGASVVGMALMARRRGGLPLALSTLVACSFLVRAFGFDVVRSPWNPHITVLPYGLLLFLTWSVICGERWALPVATGVASFLAQTHVAYVPLALPLVAIGAAAVAVARPDLPVRHRRRPALLGALAVGGLMWLPPLYQQLTGEPGNLLRIGRYFRHADGAHTLVDGWRVVSAQYGLRPEWLAGASEPTFLEEPTYLYRPVLPVLLVPVALAAVALWRRGGTAARALVGLWLAASVSAIVATARTTGLVYAYRLGWAWVLGAVGGLLVLWAGWDLVASRPAGGEPAPRERPRLGFPGLRSGARGERPLVGGAVVVLAVLSAVNSFSAVTSGTPVETSSRILAELGPAVRDRLPEGRGQVVIASTSFGALIYGAGLQLDLLRHGIDAKAAVGPDPHGDVHTYRRGPVRARLVVAMDADVAAHRARPGVELVAYAASDTVVAVFAQR